MRNAILRKGSAMVIRGISGRAVNRLLRPLGGRLVHLKALPCGRRIKMMRHHRIETVLDVGGNIGLYGAELRKSGYTGRIISFEPTDRAFRELASRAQADGHWTVSKTAIGESDGEATIHVAANHAESSSLLPMLELHKECAPRSFFVSDEKVALKTLNSALEGILQPHERVLLKIDTQGCEHMVLRGASEILPQVELIECELSFVPLYDGQMLFREMLDLLEASGFSPVQIFPGFTDPRTGYTLQVDGIFAKRDFKSADNCGAEEASRAGRGRRS